MPKKIQVTENIILEVEDVGIPNVRIMNAQSTNLLRVEPREIILLIRGLAEAAGIIAEEASLRAYESQTGQIIERE